MKWSGLLNTVEKKYIFGYGIIGVFFAVFMVISFFCNTYVSNCYSDAIAELVSVNNLETAVERLNDTVNMTYLYLTEASVETFSSEKENVEKCLNELKLQQEEHFTRELTDTEKTVETYVVKSEALMENLKEYFEEDKKSYNAMLEVLYSELQEVYGYITLRFQNAYSVKLATLSQMEGKLVLLQQYMFLLQIGILTVAVLCSMFYLIRVIRQVSDSIRAIRSGVEEMQSNVLEAKPIHVRSNDELEEFADAFNHMTKIIQKQMTEIAENADIKEQLAEMEIKNLRMFSELQKNHLDFLQSRVNPHFLFNTLNMISSLARLENADQCAELMETTASFLRYNLDNISKTVTLEREVENLKDYAAIQKCRYGGRYAYSFEIDENCLEFPMPCMILQPLMENSIQHGIAMKVEGGKVCIRVYQVKKNHRVCLEVSDNGTGLTEEQIYNIYEDLYGNQSFGSHIGIRNIYRRLRLFYHDDVEFKLKNLNPGLRILISLPWEESGK